MSKLPNHDDHNHWALDGLAAWCTILSLFVALLVIFGVAMACDLGDARSDIREMKEARCRELNNVQEYAECVDDID